MTEDNTNTNKEIDNWTTGDEPATGAQMSYLETLCQEANEEVPENITKAEAATEIERLREITDK